MTHRIFYRGFNQDGKPEGCVVIVIRHIGSRHYRHVAKICRSAKEAEEWICNRQDQDTPEEWSEYVVMPRTARIEERTTTK